jgi:hypothetical protein
MDNGSLTFGRLVMGGRSLGGRQDQIIGGKHHGGAPVILRLRSPWRSFGFVPFFLFPRRKITFVVSSVYTACYIPSLTLCSMHG